MGVFTDQLNKTTSSKGGVFSNQLNAILGTKTSVPVSQPYVNPKIAQYEAEQKLYDEEARKANSKLGLFKETFQPDTLGKAVLNTGKEIGQGILRSVGTVGITAGNIPAQITGTPKPFDESIPTDQNPFTNALFGGKPIKTVQKSTADVKEFLKPYIGETGSKYSALPLVLGGLALDLSGFGGGKAVTKAGEVPLSFLKFMAKETDSAVIESTLRRIGMDESLVKTWAEKFKPTKTVDEVRDVIKTWGVEPSAPLTPKLPGEVSKSPIPGETPAQALARSEAYAKQAHPSVIPGDQVKIVNNKTGKVTYGIVEGRAEPKTNILTSASPKVPKNLGEGIRVAPTENNMLGGNIFRYEDNTITKTNLNKQQLQEIDNAGQSRYNSLIVPPKDPYVPYSQRSAVTPDQIQAQIDLTKELLAEHPGTKLNKLIPDKVLKSNYLDKQTGENLPKSVIKKNAKKEILNRKLQSVFEGTPQSDQFDNYDVIEKAKEDAKALKERLKALQQQKKNLPILKRDINTGKPIKLTQTEQAIVGTGKRTVPFMPTKNQPQTPKPSPIDTTTGEGRSLEITADQKLGENIPDKIPPEDVSLIETISKEPTSVKDKVNIIDYIRTPDRVLKKIGLEKEGEFLRTQHEEYLKELPKNIDKISAWAKRASPNGNEDIFRYLDGEAIELLPQDKEVATEIQSWLKRWADRLGLKSTDRITYYITHIFDQELIAKEFPEELAKMLDNRLPGEVYDPFLEKRLGALGYRKDTWAALDAYAKRATRKVWMDPALDRIKQAASGLEKSAYDFTKTYVNNINMRPNDIDNLIDNGIKQVIGYKLGQRPLLTITRFARQTVYRAMLGLNPASALKNISQGVNIYAVLGEKYTTIGYLKLFNKGSKAELEREGILNAGFIEDRALSSTKKAIEMFDKGLFIFFETAEHINRGAAYFGAKAQGISKGMTEREAIEYGKKIVRDTQFVFGKIDTPIVLSSDLGKTIGQFQSFTLKQGEFLYEMGKKAVKGDEKAKNFIGLLRYAIAGTIFVYTIGKAFNMKISDLIPSVRFGTPPSMKLPYEVGKAVIDAPDKYGQDRDLKQKAKDIGNTLWGVIPAGTQIKKVIQGYEALKEGKSTDASGRAQYDVGGTPLKNTQALIFGKYAGSGAKDYYENDMTYAEATLENIKKSPTGKQDLAKIIKENPVLAQSILQVVKKQALGITKDDEKLLNMGVATKQRAKEVAKQINKLDNIEEKKALIAEYIKKKIITDDVAKQLAEFLNK